jgi:two-component system NtrC family sensor kinase
VFVKFGQNLKTIGRTIITSLSPRSVAGSIILPIVLVTVIGGAIAATVSADYMARSAAQNAAVRLDGVATQAAEQIGALLARSLGDAAALSRNPVIMSNDATSAEKLAEMKKIQMLYGTFEDVTLVDTNGNVITSTDNKYYGEWATNSLFQQAVRGTPSMSDATVSLDPYTVVIQIASPVVDTNSKITSVMAAQMSMKYIWQIIDRVRVGATGYVCLIDQSGNIIAGPDKAKLFQKIVFASDGSKMPAEHKMIQYKEGGKEMCAVLAAINPLVPWSGNKWSFVGIMPASEAFAPAHDVQVLFWIAILVLLGLFVIVGLVVGSNTSSKIRTLAKGTSEIARGNLKHRLPPMRPNELGQLGDSFNTMTARLEASADEIAKWNAHLEEEIEAKTRELEKAMASKVQSERLSAMGYIAASVAHELNDPLTAISGNAQLGVKELEKYQAGEVKPNSLKNVSDYFMNIEKDLQRSKNIIRKLISFVRYSKAKEGVVDINQVVTDTLAIVDHHLRINNVEMNTHLKPELASVIGNAQQLQQVFLNIALNAQKAMPQGGKLIVETRQIEGKGEGKVEVIFADTDGGIPTEELEKIFDPIPPTAAGGQETSLDLSVSQDIIKQHGGEIRVKSEVGVGTKFVVSLPTATGSPPEDKANSSEYPPKRRASDRGTGTTLP